MSSDSELIKQLSTTLNTIKLNDLGPLTAKKLSDYCNDEIKELNPNEQVKFDMIKQVVNDLKLNLFASSNLHKIQFTYIDGHFHLVFILSSIYKHHGSYVDFYHLGKVDSVKSDDHPGINSYNEININLFSFNHNK